MKKALLLLALLSSNVFAFYEDPHEQFDMTHNRSNNQNITFRQAANVTAACDAESRRRGLGGFNFSVDACSFWDRNPTGPDQCLIITEQTANFHTIVHEIRHCLQGNFHANKPNS